jgi:antitoxin component of MazEF toxin-antitoxin module
MLKSYTVTLLPADDGSEELILPIPDELMAELGWQTDDVIDFATKEDNSILLTNLSRKSGVAEIQHIPFKD